MDRGHQILRPAGADPLLEGPAPDLFPQRRKVLLAECRRRAPGGGLGSGWPPMARATAVPLYSALGRRAPSSTTRA